MKAGIIQTNRMSAILFYMPTLLESQQKVLVSVCDVFLNSNIYNNDIRPPPKIARFMGTDRHSSGQRTISASKILIDLNTDKTTQKQCIFAMFLLYNTDLEQGQSSFCAARMLLLALTI